MKFPEKLSLIPVLLIITQAILTLFVGQWLVSQYQQQRKILHKEVSRQFLESSVVVLDSMLAVNYIDPVLGKNRLESYTMTLRTDSSEWISAVKHGLPADESMKNDSFCPRITIVTRDTATLAMPDLAGSGAVMWNDTSDQLLMKGVKIIVQKIRDSASGKGSYSKVMESLFDTAILIRTFNNRIRNLNPQYKVIWSMAEKKGDTMIFEKESQFRFNTPMGKSVLVAEISNYACYLLKQIIPSIVFAIVLLLLTGGSFIITFRALKQQILLNRMRTGFTTNMSHELKTPVATVKLALEALQKYDMGKDPERASVYLDMATQEINRLELLVSQVLNTSLFEQGAEKIESEPVELVELVSRVVQVLKLRIEKEGAIVSLEGTGEKQIVQGDRLHLQGVLVNLLDNSLKYHTGKADITIGLKGEAEDVILTVADRGYGIPVEYREKIFEKFFRIPAGDTHNVKGYGLGLHYAARIMDLHSGSISAEERPGGGTVFILRFKRITA